MRLFKRELAKVTLVEGLAATLVLGVLLTATMPPLNLRAAENAREQALELASQAASLMNINYANCALVGHQARAPDCLTVSACVHAEDLLRQTHGLPPGYMIDGIDPGSRNGATSVCSVHGPHGSRYDFVGLAAGN